MSVTETTPAPDGETRLIRRWEARDPWLHVLLVHGLGEHSGRYEHVGDFLSEQGIEVRSFDLPGCGETTGTRAYVDSFDRFLDATEAELAQLSGPRVIIGHSLGGLITYRYAMSDRPQPEGYVLSAPAVGANAPAWQRKAAPLLAKIAPKLSMPNPIKGDQLSRDPEVAEKYFADPLVHTSATSSLGAAIFGAIDASAPLQALPGPTLVVHGGSDTVVPPTASAAFSDIDGIERKLYPALRHEMFNEPEGPEVLADVVNWLRGQFQ